MLVLSRQKNQRVNFPGLGISVEILDIKGSKVRVGVDAPMEVRILRDELDDSDKANNTPEPHIIRLPQSLRHDLRNALHELSLMLHVYRKRAEQTAVNENADQIDPEQMFEAIVERLENLSSHRALSKPGFAAARSVEHLPNLGDALVVDDDDNERELLAGFLRMCGYEVDTAPDGLRAIEYLQENHPPRVILSVNSEGEGKGSEFRVRLPTCERPAPTQPQTTEDGSGGAIRRLVLVEDNLDASKMLAYLLEDAGFQVSVARDGKRGLELIRANRPDAAIIDVGLPEMNGYDVARSLRKDTDYDNMHLIAVTGYGQAKDRSDAGEAGFDEHLVKPVDPGALNRLLLDLPHRNRSQRSLRFDPGSEPPSKPRNRGQDGVAKQSKPSDQASVDQAKAD